MTKIQIINNGNSIITVTYDGDTIIFEVNDKLDYKTGGIVENPKEIKFKPDGVVNEITFNKRELELAESLYQTTPPLNTKSYEGEIFNDSSFSSSGTKQEQYRKKEKEKPKVNNSGYAHFKINENFHLDAFKDETAINLNLVPLHWSKCILKSLSEYPSEIPLLKNVTFFFKGIYDHKLKELIELNPNYKVEFV